MSAVFLTFAGSPWSGGGQVDLLDGLLAEVGQHRPEVLVGPVRVRPGPHQGPLLAHPVDDQAQAEGQAGVLGRDEQVVDIDEQGHPVGLGRHVSSPG